MASNNWIEEQYSEEVAESIKSENSNDIVMGSLVQTIRDLNLIIYNQRIRTAAISRERNKFLKESLELKQQLNKK